MNGAASKAKGRSAENAIVEWLREHGFPHAERRRMAGIHDRGDIAGVPGLVIEAKNAERIDLAGWTDEAVREARMDEYPVVWAKRRGRSSPGQWYVIMTGLDFTEMFRELKGVKDDDSTGN